MFYDNLKQICEDRGFKITPIVQECGGASGSIGGWKKGVMPNSDILLKLSTRLNVTVDYLLKGEPNPSNPISIGNINNSSVIGNNHSPVTVTINGETSTRELTDLEQEILNIYNNLSASEKLQFFHEIYKFRKDVI